MLPHSIKIDSTTLVVMIAIILTVSLQILLCCKAKRRLVRWAPIALCAVTAIAFSIVSAYVGGWNGMGYLFFALLFAALAFVAGLTWGLCALTIRVRGNSL